MKKKGSGLAPVQHFQVMRVHHDAQDVAKWVDDRGGYKTRLAAFRNRLAHLRAHRLELRKRRLNILHLPVEHGAPGSRLHALRRVFTVDNAKLGRIVAGAKLDIGRMLRAGILKIGLDAQ